MDFITIYYVKERQSWLQEPNIIPRVNVYNCNIIIILGMHQVHKPKVQARQRGGDHAKTLTWRTWRMDLLPLT